MLLLLLLKFSFGFLNIVLDDEKRVRTWFRLWISSLFHCSFFSTLFFYFTGLLFVRRRRRRFCAIFRVALFVFLNEVNELKRILCINKRSIKSRLATQGKKIFDSSHNNNSNNNKTNQTNFQLTKKIISKKYTHRHTYFICTHTYNWTKVLTCNFHMVNRMYVFDLKAHKWIHFANFFHPHFHTLNNHTLNTHNLFYISHRC